jgi:hypothetical protein
MTVRNKGTSTPTATTTVAKRKRDHRRYAVADERKARALAEGHAADYYWPSNVKKRAAYGAKKARNRADHAMFGRPELAIQFLIDERLGREAQREAERGICRESSFLARASQANTF